MPESQSITLTFVLRPNGRLSLLQPGDGREFAIPSNPRIDAFVAAMQAAVRAQPSSSDTSEAAKPRSLCATLA